MKTTIEELYVRYMENQIIVTDTRKIIPGSIFFALRGPNFNANEFADSALEKGCKYVVVDDPGVVKDDRYLLTDDALKTLQDLARHHRRKLTIPVFGLTGSNGKTTTKELINAVVSRKFKTQATQGNLNNHIGVPLTILSIRDEHEFAIIEMGANHIGEIKFLCSIADPDAGLITNIGKAHLEGFGSEEGVRIGKGELYDHLRDKKVFVFVNVDDEKLMNMSEGMSRITYGTSENANLVGAIISADPFLQLMIKLDEEFIVQTNLTGAYNLPNILAAAAVGNRYGVSHRDIVEGIRNYAPDNMRSQVIEKNGKTIILDAYNANPSSMHVAIENFTNIKSEKKLFILGDMLELGSESDKEHRAIITQTKEAGLEGYFIGPHFAKCKDMNIQSFMNVDELIEHLKNHQPTGTILIKGSRGIKLEKVMDVL